MYLCLTKPLQKDEKYVYKYPYKYGYSPIKWRILVLSQELSLHLLSFPLKLEWDEDLW